MGRYREYFGVAKANVCTLRGSYTNGRISIFSVSDVEVLTIEEDDVDSSYDPGLRSCQPNAVKVI